MTNHPMPAECVDRFADVTDLDTLDDVAISYWRLSDGGVYEEREHRFSTRRIMGRVHHRDSVVAWRI